MKRLSALELMFFAVESGARPMHAGAVLVFDPPGNGEGVEGVEQIVAALRAAQPVAPWNQRPVFGLPAPHWETVPEFDIDHHLRRIRLPVPGSSDQLMNLVSQLYPGQLDRSRPLWEATVVEGLENGGWALVFMGHHALADGGSGLRMFHEALRNAPHNPPKAMWAVSPERVGSREPASGGSGLAMIATRLRGAIVEGTTAASGLVKLIPQTIRLARSGALPFEAASSPRMSERITSSRSFASFELPAREAKQIASAAGGTVNDVLLSVCGDALQRYHKEPGATADRALTAMMAVSTRQAGDEDSSNAVGATLIALGAPDATPSQRLNHVVAATRRAKATLRQTPGPMLQLQVLGLMSAMEVREQLPIGRGLVPHVANFTMSNIPGGLPETRYLGRAELAALYITPIVPAAQELNFTALTYRDTICVGIGAARNIVPDTARLARLASESFDDLQRSV